MADLASRSEGFRAEAFLTSPLNIMVLQRGRANAIWGWSDPGDKVRVEIAGKHANGTEIGASAWVENPRVYLILDGVLKPGKNVLALQKGIDRINWAKQSAAIMRRARICRGRS